MTDRAALWSSLTNKTRYLAMTVFLDTSKVVETITLLIRRIGERFPDSGLLNIANNLRTLAIDGVARSELISKPNLFLRVSVGGIIFFAIALFIFSVNHIDLAEKKLDIGELVQLTEAGLNTIVIIVAAAIFLITVENRIKRIRAMASLHQLRTIIHVIDMHQLTKDPSSVLSIPTDSSPERTMSRSELNRYLDYCSELLSLTSKIAAVYGQAIHDREVASAVSEVETLTIGLSRKIWQKIATIGSIKKQ